MAVLAGLVIDRSRSRAVQFVGMAAATAVCYAFGTAWFCLSMDSTVSAALGLCVLPFIPGDVVKMLLAMTFGRCSGSGWSGPGCTGADRSGEGASGPLPKSFLSEKKDLTSGARVHIMTPTSQ